MKIPKLILSAALAACFAAATASDAGAEIARTFNYQGFLLSKETNQPVDGSKHVRFVIYDGAGGALFTETVCNVPMNNGRYEVEVGSTTPGGITPDIFINNQNLWMQVEIAPTAVCGGSFDPLSPRVRLQAAPFAFNSLYASTASAATPLFSADIIGALSQTVNGAITISTNLFVQGGISVGSISPGQQLSVSGLVESQGVSGCDVGPDYTCGFKFPDGSVQVTAAAETKWELNGSDMYTEVTIQRVGIGEIAPRARLHISSGIGSSGDMLLISTGSSDLVRINGEGRIYANYFHGDGSNLTGATAADLLRVLKAGDSMTGPLTLSGSSSMTIVNTNNSLPYSLAVTTDPARQVYHLTVATSGSVGLGTISPAARLDVAARGAAHDIQAQIWRDGGGVVVGSMSSTGVMKAAFFQGDGSGLNNVFSTDPTRVLKAGDTMTGQLTLAGSSLTVTGSAGLALGDGEWFSVGASTADHKVYIDGGMLATSSVTAQGGFFGPSASLTGHLGAGAVTATSGTFTNWGTGQYSIVTTSGIKVGNGGFVEAPFYLGSGVYLTDVLGTDTTKVRKTGDIMTGSLRVEGSSVGIFGYGSASAYALTVATVTNPTVYALSVSTRGGFVGAGVPVANYPLHASTTIGITAEVGRNVALVMRPFGAEGFIKWEEEGLDTPKGVLGMPATFRDLVYRAGSGNIAGPAGIEVFRIRESGNFGIGTHRHSATFNPAAGFHVATDLLVSTGTLSAGGTYAPPVLFISSSTGRIGVGTAAPSTHKLVVNGDMIVNSSLTVAGLYGSSAYGGLAIGAASAQARLHVVESGDETYTLIVGSNNAFGIDYDMVVTTQGWVGIGLNTPLAKLHVSESLQIGTSFDGQGARLKLNPAGGASYIYFSDQAQTEKAAMGTLGGQTDFLYLAGAKENFTEGTEVYRIKKAGQFGIYHSAPTERLHIGANTLISTAAVTPILYASTSTARIGVGTRSPSARLHLSSGSFYNDGAGAGITTLGNVTAAAYYGDGSALSGVITSTDVIVADIAARVEKAGDTMSGTLNVDASANFGDPGTKSTFTAAGFWQPRAMTGAELAAYSPETEGLVVLNSTVYDLCVSTGTGAGDWARVGSGGAGACY